MKKYFILFFLLPYFLGSCGKSKDNIIHNFQKNTDRIFENLLKETGQDLTFNKITAFVSEIKIGQTGYAYLIDSNALIVYHPNREIIGKTFSTFSIQKIIENSSSNQKGLLRYVFDGNEYIAAFYNIPNSNLILIIKAPTDELKYLNFISK